MTRYAPAITQRLHDAAERIPVDGDSRPLVDLVEHGDTGRAPGGRRSPSRRRVGLAGAAVVAGAAAAGLLAVVAIGLPNDTDTVEVGPAGGDPVPGAVAPHVASPPEWFGEPRSAGADGARTGQWVSMAIGRVSGDRITDPIVVSAFDGGYGPLAGAEAVTVDGTSLRSLRADGWQALATAGTPTVMASGAVDERTLAAVLAAVDVSRPPAQLSLRLPTRPGGYTEVVSPRALGPEPAMLRVLAGGRGDVGIYEQSSYTDPLLLAAWSGADITRVDLAGGPGWVGRSRSGSQGQLRFLAWSPRPGVVFEITTDDPQRSDRDLVELARATSPMGVDEWDELYGG